MGSKEEKVTHAVIQTAKAVAARGVAGGLMFGAAACSATAWGAESLAFLAVAAAAVDLTSPFLWGVAMKGGKAARAALLASCVAITLSASSIWVVASENIAKPLAAAAVAETTVADAGADLTLLREQIAGRSEEAARLAAATTAAQDALAAAQGVATEAQSAEDEAKAQRDAADACAAGKYQPDDANPKCRDRTMKWSDAATKTARALDGVAAASAALTTAQDAEARAADQHAKREERLEKLGSRKDDAGAASTGGVYAFRWVSERIGFVTSEDIAMFVSALIAGAVAMMATVAPAALISAAPLPTRGQRGQASGRGGRTAGQPSATAPATAVATHSQEDRRDPEVKARLIREAQHLVSSGLSVRNVAEQMGIPRSTLQTWLRQAQIAPVRLVHAR